MHDFLDISVFSFPIIYRLSPKDLERMTSIFIHIIDKLSPTAFAISNK